MQCQFVSEIVKESDILMAITIEQALRPLLLTFFVLGFGVYFPEKTYLNIFYDLLIWIIYFCLYYYVIIEFYIEKWFLEISIIINAVISISIITISVIINIYNNKKFRILIKRLAAVDNTLEKLGTPKLYCKLHTYVKRLLIGWLIFIISININDMAWFHTCMKEKIWCFILPYLLNHHSHVNVFLDLLFVTFLWYIGTRFDKLNERMRYLLVEKKYGLRYTWRKTVLNIHRNIIYTNHKRVLWTSMHLHLELCKIARELNGMYEIQMTIEIINCMICFLRYYKFLYIHVQTKFLLIFSPLMWLDMVIWLLLYGIKLFYINYVCESVSTKANEMEKIVPQLTDFLRYADVRDEIYQFTLQMIYHPLKFTGLGFFYFGNGLLRKFIMQFITYGIIIIQMASIPEILKHLMEEDPTSSSTN